jgi:hypothetical protein
LRQRDPANRQQDLRGGEWLEDTSETRLGDRAGLGNESRCGETQGEKVAHGLCSRNEETKVSSNEVVGPNYQLATIASKSRHAKSTSPTIA